MTRRDFGRIVNRAGIGLAGAGLLAGQTGTAHAATSTWRVTGGIGSGLSGFDTRMQTFMQARNIRYGSLAVARNGQLKLARGYTWAPVSMANAQPTSLFRIASLSKPITGAAILKLVQNGQLSLSATLTSLLTLTPPPGGSLDPRLGNVTVRRLLHHLGGWDRGITIDPMFNDFTISSALGVPLPIGKSDVIRYTNGVALNHNPGSVYAYSNYGYLLLSRIIEAVSGVPYATYVQQHILGPRQITRMRLGRTLAANAAPGEVPYSSQYSRPTVFNSSGTYVPNPYGAFNLENMDAHGGWLSSAVDMVRFCHIFDAANPVLSAASISTAFAVPETGVNPGGWWYGCGWQVRNVTGGRNTWHTGALDGTFTLLVRRWDGLTWAALFNQRDDPSGLDYGAVDNELHLAANAVTSWPSVDLYPQYF
ncbi:serine hydrolase domain-containing protein [Rhizohabitans arisaemae]|uniref:serine hydrolase domain-containing protein n=1 Tax=Rhizohabitans arisaemae TaxID=2720610 RepID=UPI0024B089B9|nr:serine hydrolase domain-containing protein [Rhizohabitans arisaemae]